MIQIWNSFPCFILESKRKNEIGKLTSKSRLRIRMQKREWSRFEIDGEKEKIGTRRSVKTGERERERERPREKRWADKITLCYATLALCGPHGLGLIFLCRESLSILKSLTFDGDLIENKIKIKIKAQWYEFIELGPLFIGCFNLVSLNLILMV